MSTTIPDLLYQPYAVAGGQVTWSDFFCGGGGSSLGLHHVPGFHVKYALNHWDLAVQAHSANFTDTDHEVTEIQDVHPSRFDRTDCAWFSPSCTAQAYCGPRGIDDDSVRSRATMWDVCRWTAFHRYDIVVVENVIEAKLWCDKHVITHPTTGKRKGCSCGSSYDDWVGEMEKLGYEMQEVYFNSQHAMVPQSRDRLYMVFVRSGMTRPDLDFNPPCWCSTCGDAVAGAQTWKMPAASSNRAQPRLHQWGRYGKQYVYTCMACAEVVAPAVLGSWSIIDDSIPISTIGSRKRPIAPATRKRIRVGIERVGRQQGMQVAVGGSLFERPGYARVWSLDDPLRTITATSYMAMVLRAGGQAPSPRSMNDPMMTLTAHDRQIGMLLSAGGAEAAARSTADASHTILSYDRLGVVIPNKTNNVGRSTDEPAGAITSGGSHMLVTLRKGMGDRPLHEPQAAQATRMDQALVSLRNNCDAESDDHPARTIAAGGKHHGLLVYNGVPGFVRALDDAAGTITARDKQSLLVPYNRTGIPQSTTGPAPTITAAETSSMLEVTDADIDDMLFRMLQWPELQRGQAMHVMPDGTPYKLEARVKTVRGRYRDASNQDKVKMVGNAVSSPVAAAIGHSIARAYAVAA